MKRETNLRTFNIGYFLNKQFENKQITLLFIYNEYRIDRKEIFCNLALSFSEQLGTVCTYYQMN